MTVGIDDRYYRLALARARDNDLSGAVRLAKLALLLNEKHEKARKLHEICMYELGGTGNISEAQFRDLSGSMGFLARRKALSLLKSEPQNVRVLNIQGLLYALSGRYKKAAAFFAAALEKDSGNELAARCLIEAAKRRSR